MYWFIFAVYLKIKITAKVNNTAICQRASSLPYAPR